MRSEKVVQVQP